MWRVSLSFLALLLVVISCGRNKEESSATINDIDDLKTQQYAINGKAIYDNLCANCHQLDGKGLGRLIPPLAGSDYMNEDVARTVQIIKYGQSGEIVVNGVAYNQPMPPNPRLTSMEIAEVATYIYNVWGNQRGLISPKEVEEYLAGNK